MSNLIAFVGDDALCTAIRPLVPPGAIFECLDIDGAIAALTQEQVTILIIAYDTLDWRGAIDRLAPLVAAAAARPLAIFALVPRGDPEALLAVFDLGVADAACMPIDPHEIRARLATVFKRRRTAQARHAETQAVLRLAAVDPVTGLFNRQHLDIVLPAAVDAARADDQPLALLMLDLDSLKPFNDRYGHAAGDRVLRAVARTLQGQIRGSDMAARYGGDEIAVVMPATDLDTARTIASRINAAVAGARIGRANDRPMSVTISVGVAVLTVADRDARALLKRADAALYDAKRLGRNRVAEAA